MKVHKLTIISDGALYPKVWLDGMPISGIRRLDLNSEIGEPVTATIELIVELGDVPNKLPHL